MPTFHKLFFVLVVVLMLGGLVAGPVIAYTTKKEVVATVTSSDRVCTGGEQLSCKYLIFTDTTTYQNTDSLWYWKWNSSDIVGRLKEGQTYRLTIYGWRIPLLSMYPNIVKVEKS